MPRRFTLSSIDALRSWCCGTDSGPPRQPGWSGRAEASAGAAATRAQASARRRGERRARGASGRLGPGVAMNDVTGAGQASRHGRSWSEKTGNEPGLDSGAAAGRRRQGRRRPARSAAMAAGRAVGEAHPFACRAARPARCDARRVPSFARGASGIGQPRLRTAAVPHRPATVAQSSRERPRGTRRSGRSAWQHGPRGTPLRRVPIRGRCTAATLASPAADARGPRAILAPGA